MASPSEVYYFTIQPMSEVMQASARCYAPHHGGLFFELYCFGGKQQTFALKSALRGRSGYATAAHKKRQTRTPRVETPNPDPESRDPKPGPRVETQNPDPRAETREPRAET